MAAKTSSQPPLKPVTDPCAQCAACHRPFDEHGKMRGTCPPGYGVAYNSKFVMSAVLWKSKRVEPL